MSLTSVGNWMKTHRWWVALVVVVVTGYSLGKDRAFRDNRADAPQVAEAS